MAGYVLSMYRECKIALVLVALIAMPAFSSFSQLTIDSVEGDVFVRHGVEEEWVEASVGSTLRPEDSIKTGKNSSAVLRLNDDSIYRIPAEIIVDGADFRSMDREELLMRLAMEDMLSVPERMDDDRPVPRTTVLHGSPRGRVAEDTEQINFETARFRINGARYLVEHDYRGTAVLKIRETLRLYPDGAYRINAMMLAAESLETLILLEEAARYYRTILDEDIDADTRNRAEVRLAILREQKEQ